jgi:hypothetical protein
MSSGMNNTPRYYYRPVGGVIARPTAQYNVGPNSCDNRGVALSFHTTDTALIAAREPRHATGKE